jgi:hypothetical protein
LGLSYNITGTDFLLCSPNAAYTLIRFFTWRFVFSGLQSTCIEAQPQANKRQVSAIYTGILQGGPMFESLSERIEKDERGTVDPKQRLLFWVAIFVVVFAACFFGIKLFGS